MTKYLVAKLDSNGQLDAPEIGNFFVMEIDSKFISQMTSLSIAVEAAAAIIHPGVTSMEVYLESYLIQTNLSHEKVTEELTELLCENNRQYAVVDEEYLKKFTFVDNEDYEFAKLRVHENRCVVFAADSEYGRVEVFTTTISLAALLELL